MFSLKSIHDLSFLPKVRKPKNVCARSFGRAKIINTVNSNFYLLTTFCEILTHRFLFTFRNDVGLTAEQAWLRGPSLIIQLLLCCIFFNSYSTFLCKPVSRINLRIRVDCKSGVSYLVVSHVDYVDAFLEYVSNLLYVNSVF